jgi:hypothetical protein
VKNIVYRFVGDVRSDELKTDLTGRVSFEKGDILSKDDKPRRVDSVHRELTDEESKRVPTLWVYLFNPLANLEVEARNACMMGAVLRVELQQGPIKES